jgi:hypothetical protein
MFIFQTEVEMWPFEELPSTEGPFTNDVTSEEFSLIEFFKPLFYFLGIRNWVAMEMMIVIILGGLFLLFAIILIYILFICCNPNQDGGQNEQGEFQLPSNDMTDCVENANNTDIAIEIDTPKFPNLVTLRPKKEKFETQSETGLRRATFYRAGGSSTESVFFSGSRKRLSVELSDLGQKMGILQNRLSILGDLKNKWDSNISVQT